MMSSRIDPLSDHVSRKYGGVFGQNPLSPHNRPPHCRSITQSMIPRSNAAPTHLWKETGKGCCDTGIPNLPRIHKNIQRKAYSLVEPNYVIFISIIQIKSGSKINPNYIVHTNYVEFTSTSKLRQVHWRIQKVVFVNTANLRRFHHRVQISTSKVHRVH